MIYCRVVAMTTFPPQPECDEWQYMVQMNNEEHALIWLQSFHNVLMLMKAYMQRWESVSLCERRQQLEAVIIQWSHQTWIAHWNNSLEPKAVSYHRGTFPRTLLQLLGSCLVANISTMVAYTATFKLREFHNYSNFLNIHCRAAQNTTFSQYFDWKL